MNIKIINISLFLLLSITQLSAQSENSLFSNKNRMAFGDYLFCESDYLRAIVEYNVVLRSEWKDSLQFKIGLANFKMGKYREAIFEFGKLKSDLFLKTKATFETFRSQYRLGEYNLLRQEIEQFTNHHSNYENNLSNLSKATLLLDNSEMPEKKDFLSTYSFEDRKRIEYFYNWKNNPPYKSPTKAALLSALLPGLGKVYAGEVSDGITAFLFTGFFTYLSVNKFQNNHNTSGWLYASIAAFFYGGNIYGSIAAAQNYNVGIKFDFLNDVKIFINEKKEYIPEPKIGCKNK